VHGDVTRGAPADGTTSDLLGNGAWETEDATIVNSVVDNVNYYYYIWASNNDKLDRLYGCRVTYTLESVDFI